MANMEDKEHYDRLINLKNEISNLHKCEYVEIIKILEKNDIKYTKNKNGFFINLTKMPINIIEDIEKLIEFIKNNLKNLI